MYLQKCSFFLLIYELLSQQQGRAEHCFWMNLYNFVCLTQFIYLFAEELPANSVVQFFWATL